MAKIYIGRWPSGKAPGFGPGIRGFESSPPSSFAERPPVVFLVNLFKNLSKHFYALER